MNIEIRREMIGDENAICDVIEDAFKDIEYSGHNEHIIVNELRKAQALTLSLVAIKDQELAGHVALSPVTISPQVDGWFGLGPVSVRPSCQLLGIGSSLITDALYQLKKQGARGCVVVGNPDFYNHFGFRQCKKLKLEGVDVLPKYFQFLTLSGVETESEPDGFLNYHPAFFIR